MSWISCFPGHPACLQDAASEKQVRKNPPRQPFYVSIKSG
jgi:hypothetical protein